MVESCIKLIKLIELIGSIVGPEIEKDSIRYYLTSQSTNQLFNQIYSL